MSDIYKMLFCICVGMIGTAGCNHIIWSLNNFNYCYTHIPEGYELKQPSSLFDNPYIFSSNCYYTKVEHIIQKPCDGISKECEVIR